MICFGLQILLKVNCLEPKMYPIHRTALKNEVSAGPRGTRNCLYLLFEAKVLPAFSKAAGCRAQFAGGKRPAPTEPAGETSAPRPCPYGRAAQERKLGKQRSVFPGRRSASAVNSRGLHPGQFTPVRTAGARARRGLSPRQTCRMAAQDNSRGLHPGQFAGVAPQAIRAHGSSLRSCSSKR